MARPFQIIFEDNHLIIVNKPAGLLIQGDRTGDITLPDLVKEYLRVEYNKPGEAFLGVVHRLDRPVSGVVVFAKTSKALTRMTELFKKREVQKTYWAVVSNRPPARKAFMRQWLVKNPDNNTVQVYTEDSKGSQMAELNYRSLGKFGPHYLLEVQPITGRSHQIRAQLSFNGTPIRGDIKYGYATPNTDKTINLHARRIHFIHPVKKEPIIAEAPLPGGFWEQFLNLEDFKVKEKWVNNYYSG